MERKKLTQGTINGYGFLLFGSMIGTMIQMMYLTFFMTEFLLVPPATVATALLAARIVDFIVGFLTGAIIEKFQLPWGKYRSWLLLLRWFAIAGLVLEFFPSGSFPTAAKIVIVFIGYMFHNIGMGISTTAYYALGPLLAGDDMKGRMSMSARGQVFTSIGMLIFSAACQPFITALSGPLGPQTAYMVVAIVFCIPFIFSCQIVSNISREVDPGGVKHTANKVVTFKDMLDAVIQNKQLLVLMVAYILFNIAGQVGSNLGTYYYQYIVGNMMFISLGGTIGMIVGLIASVIVPPFGIKMGKKRALVTGMLVSGIISIVKITAGGNWIMFVVWGAVAAFAGYLYSSIGINYFIDTGEAHLYKTGKDLRSVSSAMFGTPIKFGFMFGGAIATYGLAVIGYEPGMVVTAAFQSKFMFLQCGIPGIMMIVSALIFAVGYKLKDDEVAMYAKVNYERMMAAQKAEEAVKAEE